MTTFAPPDPATRWQPVVVDRPAVVARLRREAGEFAQHRNALLVPGLVEADRIIDAFPPAPPAPTPRETPTMPHTPQRRWTIRNAENNRNSGYVFAGQIAATFVDETVDPDRPFTVVVVTTGGAPIAEMDHATRKAALDRCTAIMRFAEGDDTPTDPTDDGD